MNTPFSCCTRQGSIDELDTRLRRKMVIVGDGECGKTCLVTRMSTGTFIDTGYIPTVFETDVVSVNTGQEEVELVIYDTAGQEDYDRLRPFSYSDVDVTLLCFSLADMDTLTNVMEHWVSEVRHFCGEAPIILVGNKKDLRDSESSLSSSKSSLTTDNHHTIKKVNVSDNLKEIKSSVPSLYTTSRPVFPAQAPVKHSEGTLVARKIGAMAYFETSALTGDNVAELLLATTKAAVLGTKKSRKFKPFNDTLKSWKSVTALEKL